jgi:hypothetical protein
MNQKRPVGLEHEQANRLWKTCGEPTGIEDLATSDQEVHGKRTLLAASDMTEGQSLRHVQGRVD